MLWSGNRKQVVMVELTVPWEERVEESNHLKRIKYEGLLQECVANGWQTWVLPVEVGCRGFPAQSAWNAMRILGLVGNKRKEAMQNIVRAVEKASCWLWMRRDDKDWQPGAQA